MPVVGLTHNGYQHAWPGARRCVRTMHSLTAPCTVQPIKGVGKGAYGVVCSARVAGSKDKVAIKKIQNAFENETDARRTLREVTLLRQLHHENVVKLVDIMKPTGSCKESFKEVYLVYELMDTDLHQIIRSKQALSDEHFQYFLYQVCTHRHQQSSSLRSLQSTRRSVLQFGMQQILRAEQIPRSSEHILRAQAGAASAINAAARTA